MRCCWLTTDLLKLPTNLHLMKKLAVLSILVAPILIFILSSMKPLVFRPGNLPSSSVNLSLPSPPSLLILGDWGGHGKPPYTSARQLRCAASMSRVSKRLSSAGKRVSVVSVGDNFYPHGVRSANDSRFQSTFEAVYEGIGDRWFVVAGNHDYEGNVTAQLEYASRNKRWYYPHYYYNYLFPSSTSSGVLVELLMLDTQILCGGAGKLSTLLSSRHWQWLASRLASSRARHMVVAGHTPIMSVSAHGVNTCLLERLLPLLLAHQSWLYVSGHDHNMQHLSHRGVHQVISGSSNYNDPRQTNILHMPGDSTSHLFWAEAPGAYVSVVPEDTHMTVSFISCDDSTEFHTFTIQPRTNITRT